MHTESNVISRIELIKNCPEDCRYIVDKRCTFMGHYPPPGIKRCFCNYEKDEKKHSQQKNNLTKDCPDDCMYIRLEVNKDPRCIYQGGYYRLPGMKKCFCDYQKDEMKEFLEYTGDAED